MERDGSYYTNLINGAFDSFEDVSETQAELQPTAPIKDMNKSSKSNLKQKGKNFTDDEDRLLVAAWLNVSTNPTQGTNQTRGTFWRRVYLFFEENRGNSAERSEGSLLHRWSSIQDAVSKFCGCINSIETRNQSGMTIHDRVEQAEKLFKNQDPQHKTFQFRHCWLLLRNQPKWHDKLQQLVAAKTSNKKQKTSKKSSPSNVEAASQDMNDVLPAEIVIPEPEALERPIGKKKAKEALRRGGSEGCKEALDILWAKKVEADQEKEVKREERYAKSYALDKERLELDKERIELDKERIALEREKLSNEANNNYLKRIAEEERIINMDLSSLNEMQQQYYMNLQSEIITRRMN